MAIRHSRVFRTWIITPADTRYEEANVFALEEVKPWIGKDQTIEMGECCRTRDGV